jgi:transcription elongation factor GreA
MKQKKIALGWTVDIHDKTGNRKETFRLLSSENAHPTAGSLSVTSPVGKALLDHQTGDTVSVDTPTGIREYEILAASEN